MNELVATINTLSAVIADWQNKYAKLNQTMESAVRQRDEKIRELEAKVASLEPNNVTPIREPAE